MRCNGNGCGKHIDQTHDKAPGRVPKQAPHFHPFLPSVLWLFPPNSSARLWISNECCAQVGAGTRHLVSAKFPDQNFNVQTSTSYGTCVRLYRAFVVCAEVFKVGKIKIISENVWWWLMIGCGVSRCANVCFVRYRLVLKTYSKNAHCWFFCDRCIREILMIGKSMVSLLMYA